LVVGGLGLVPLTSGVPDAALTYYAVPELLAGALFGLSGAWVASRRPANTVGWLLLASGTGHAVSFFSTQYGALALVTAPSHHLPLGFLAGALAQVSYVMPMMLDRTLLLFAFPENRLDTRAGRGVTALAILGGVVVLLAVLGTRMVSFGPLFVPALAGVSAWVLRWGLLILSMLNAACLAALVARSWRAEPPLRGALWCFSIGATMMFVAFAVPAVVHVFVPRFNEAWLGPLLTTPAVLLLATAGALAVLRYHLWGLDVILRRSLVFIVLTACLGAAYLGLVAAADLVFSPSGVASSLAAALVIAGLASPLRGRLQELIDRLLYGHRRNPDEAVARLGRRLGTMDQGDELLAEVASLIASSLRVPYVSMSERDLRSGDVKLAAAWGRERCGTESVALRVGDEEVGRLEVGLREPGLVLQGADRRLLEDLAGQAALAVVSVGRTRELQAAREQLVGAREEERRRIRRNLHDGLGPGLAAATLQLDETVELIGSDPEAARDVVRRLRRDVETLLGDIRRLVYDLRPPALDDLGLVAAVRQHAESLAAGPVTFTVDAEPSRPVLPAAVEVALWRIATEAMTNVVRHAEAQHCWVRLHVGAKAAELDISDDGRGVDGARAGVGLASLRERAAELGGHCTVETREDGTGTRVHAALPLATST